MSRVYFGKYIFRQSFIHSLNPLAKLLSLSLLMSSAAFIDSYSRLIFFIILLAAAAFFAKIRAGELYASVRSFRFFIIFTFLVQMFITETGDFILPIYAEHLQKALLSTLKFILIICYSALFTLTSSPADIAKALFFFIKPFKKIGVNTRNAAISLLVAVRFIPILFEESHKIITAQKLRGLWNHNTFKNKLKFMTKAESFIIPLFTRLTRYAENISITVAYRHNLESHMNLPKISLNDIIFISLSGLSLLVAYVL